MRRFQSYTVESYLQHLRNTKIMRQITDIHLHHTWKPTKKTYVLASNKERVIYSMWRYHTQIMGWQDIGQHITISPDGLIWDGRDIREIPASIKGHNQNAIAIEMIGNFDKGQEILEGDQLETAIKLLKGLFEIFHTKNLVFHRDYSNKTCPGTSLDKKMFLDRIENNVKIMGETKAKPTQMKQYLLEVNSAPKLNCTVDEIISYYMEEGAIEGVRSDVAFAQALLETNFFKFNGSILPAQNNYAGLGAIDASIDGKTISFSSPRKGVRAHIQHLKGYASREKLKNPVVDPRYIILVKNGLIGTAPYVNDLNGKWAVPGNRYGESIIKILDNILAFKVKEQMIDTENSKLIEKNKQLKEENIKLNGKIKAYKDLLMQINKNINNILETDV